MLNLYISSNICSVDKLNQLFNLIDSLKGGENTTLGLELFPEFQNPEFDEFLTSNIEILQNYKMSLHGPYFFTEHSKPKGTTQYQAAMEYFTKSLKLGKDTNASYIVYHHNNCEVTHDTKKEMIENANENLVQLTKISKEYGVEIVVENAGVMQRNNMLFNEQEFLDMAIEIPNNILIDIGHAFANGWDIENVVSKLKHKIIAYHLHNNDGSHDNHDSILNGAYDMKEFIRIYKKYTPSAELVIEYSQTYLEKPQVLQSDIEWLENKLS